MTGGVPRRSDRIMPVEEKRELRGVPLDDLKPYPRNPRKNDDAVKKVASSLKQFGFVKNSVVVDENLEVITGHTTIKAMRSLGWSTCPVVTQVFGLTEGEKKAYRIADNRLGEEAAWDLDLLGEELANLEDMGFEAEVMGFDDGEVGRRQALEAKHKKVYGVGETALKDRMTFIDDEEKALSLDPEHAALFEGRPTILVYFSGGRDSTFALLWAKTNFPDRRIIGVFSDTGVELPGMTVHVKKVCDHLGVDLKIVKPDDDMLIDIAENGFPASVFLPCREKYIYRPINRYIKTFPPEEVVVLDGSRGDQALKKSTKTKTSVPPGMEKYTYYHPAFDVAAETQQEILDKSGVPVWEGYAQGFARTACWCCPGQSGQQAAALKRNYPGLFAYVQKLEVLSGTILDWNNKPPRSIAQKAEAGERGGRGRARKSQD